MDIDKQRIGWIDYGKGIGIILVVYGHLLSSGYHAKLEIPIHFFKLSDSILYSFHVPFFFFLSGIFTENSLRNRGIKGYIGNALQRIAYPYLIWSVLQLALEIIFSHNTYYLVSALDIFKVFFIPQQQFWFLYALLVMRLTFLLCSISGWFSKYLILILSVVIFFKPIPLHLFALDGVSAHLIFFVIGLFFAKNCPSLQACKMSLLVACSLLVLLILSGKYVFENVIEPARIAYTGHHIYFLYFSILGGLICVFLAQFLAARKLLSFIQNIGKYSIQILVAHMIFGVATRVFLFRVFGTQNWITHIFFGVIFSIAMPIFLYIYSNIIGISWLFNLPANLLGKIFKDSVNE